MSLEGGREGRGGEGSPPSHFGDFFFKHFKQVVHSSINIMLTMFGDLYLRDGNTEGK